MKTVTRIENVEQLPSGSTVVTVLGGERVGTTDPALGARALELYKANPDHSMWEIEYEVRGDKLYLLGILDDYADNPMDETDDVEAPHPVAPEGEKQQVKSLDDLLTMEERLSRVEAHLGLS